MTKTKIGHRQLIILFCVFLLFCTISAPAFADKQQNMEITYIVTDDMIAKPSVSPNPTATPKPTTSPQRPDTPPKTGDPNQLAMYGLIAGSSMLGLLGIFAYYIKKKEHEND